MDGSSVLSASQISTPVEMESAISNALQISSTQSLSIPTFQALVSTPTTTVITSSQSLSSPVVSPSPSSVSSLSSSMDSASGSTSSSSLTSVSSSSSATSSPNLSSGSSSGVGSESTSGSSPTISESSTPVLDSSTGKGSVTTVSIPRSQFLNPPTTSLPNTLAEIATGSIPVPHAQSTSEPDVEMSSTSYTQVQASQHPRPIDSTVSHTVASASYTRTRTLIPVTSTVLRSSNRQESATIPIIAAETSVNTATFTDVEIYSSTTQVFTTTYSTTLASSSGTASSGQVVEITQTSIRTTVTPVESAAHIAAPGPNNTQSTVGSKHNSSVLLAAVLVPILVTLLVVVPCVILILRWRRRRRIRFMPDYGFVSNPPDYPYSVRRVSNESVATTRESQYDMCSVPSASMVHTDLLPRDYEPPSGSLTTPRDPFADSPEDDVRSPLFIETNVPPVNAGERGSPSPSAGSTRSPGWRAFSPTSSIADSIHRARSRIGTLASGHSDSRSHSDSRAGSRSPFTMLHKSGASGSGGRVSHADDPFSDADWNHMDDPFANLNARSVDLDDASRADIRKDSSQGTYSGLLQKIRHRS